MPTVIVDGYEFPAKYIGKGQYSKVYRVGNRVVYYTRGDCAKEVMSMFQYDRISHLPEMIRHDNVRGYGSMIWYVFSSPFYQNVTKKHISAWRIMHDLIGFYKEFWSEERRYQYQTYGKVSVNIDVMQKFIDFVRNMPASMVPRSVVVALQEIVNIASNCDRNNIGFDFHKKNFGVNEYGTLIFRDPFYVYSGG